jgi:hypothetical protein
MLAADAACRSGSTLGEDADSGESKEADSGDDGVGVIPVVGPGENGDCLNGCLCSLIADCACFKADACPGYCNLAQGLEPDGAVSELFCHGIVWCDADGAAWSFGEPRNTCGNGMVRYLDGRPDGSFCCESAGGAGLDTAKDAAADASAE